MSGCARRPPAAEARVRVDVVDPVRLGRLEHRAEQPVRARQRPHRLDQLLAHARGDEARERALAVGHAERGVARPAELARRVDEPLQHRLDLALGGHRQHDVGERAEGRGVGHASTVRRARRRHRGGPRPMEDEDRDAPRRGALGVGGEAGVGRAAPPARCARGARPPPRRRGTPSARPRRRSGPSGCARRLWRHAGCLGVAVVRSR